MGDFKINLFNCHLGKNTSDFVDILYFHALYPAINSPTRITADLKTSTDNIL